VLSSIGRAGADFVFTVRSDFTATFDFAAAMTVPGREVTTAGA